MPRLILLFREIFGDKPCIIQGRQLVQLDLVPLHGSNLSVDLEHAHGPNEVRDGGVDRVELGEVRGQSVPRPVLQPGLEPF